MPLQQRGKNAWKLFSIWRIFNSKSDTEKRSFTKTVFVRSDSSELLSHRRNCMLQWVSHSAWLVHRFGFPFAFRVCLNWCFDAKFNMFDVTTNVGNFRSISCWDVNVKRSSVTAKITESKTIFNWNISRVRFCAIFVLFSRKYNRQQCRCKPRQTKANRYQFQLNQTHFVHQKASNCCLITAAHFQFG